jgi:hypothetical protein
MRKPILVQHALGASLRRVGDKARHERNRPLRTSRLAKPALDAVRFSERQRRLAAVSRSQRIRRAKIDAGVAQRGYFALRGNAASLADTLRVLPTLVGRFAKPRYFNAPQGQEAE